MLSSAGTSEIPKEDLFKTAETASPAPLSGITGNANIPGSSSNGPGNSSGNGSASRPGNISGNTQAPAPELSAGVLISGARATEFMDTALPALLVWLAAVAGFEMDKKGLQLDAGEKKTIAPFMQDMLNALKFNFNNPFINFAVVIGIIYGAKILSDLPNIKVKQAKKVVQMKPVDAAEMVQQTINKIQERANKLKEETKLLKEMGRQKGIVWLTMNKKLSKANAAIWYDKNVK